MVEKDFSSTCNALPVGENDHVSLWLSSTPGRYLKIRHHRQQGGRGRFSPERSAKPSEIEAPAGRAAGYW